MAMDYFDSSGTNNPSPRAEMAVFGGFDPGSGDYLDELLTGNGGCLISHHQPRPTPRSQYALATDLSRGMLVMFSGLDGSDLGDLWEWDGATWYDRTSTSTGDVPSSRRAAAMVYDRANNRLVLFGGFHSGVLGDTRIATWTGTGWQWTLIEGDGPAARAGARMVYDSGRGAVILFGGHDGTHQFGDTWEFANGHWSQTSTSGPGARRDHGLAYDIRRAKVVLFGGLIGNDVADADFLGDTWEYDPYSHIWTLVATDGPSPRSAFGMAYNPCLSRCVIFGGITPSGAKADIWEFNGQCRGDLNGDGIVDLTDLSILLSRFGCTVP